MSEYKMRAAKATQSDIDEMRKFLFELEEKVNNPDFDLDDIGTFCHAKFNSCCGRHFQRILFGYETLIENACDPNLDYLEWKPEIKQLLGS